MTDNTSTVVPSMPRLVSPDECSMLMGFDTPNRDEVIKCRNPRNPLSPLIPCPSDDPFDLVELAAARENDPFELAAAGRKSNTGEVHRALSDTDLTHVSNQGPVSSTPLSRATHRALQSSPGRSPISHHLALNDHITGKVSVGQNEPEGATLPDFLHIQQESLRISNILKLLGDYDDLVEEDIRHEIAPWDDHSMSLHTILGESDDIDEFGLPRVRTYFDVSSSKVDGSQQDIDSQLKQYQEDNIACDDASSTSQTEESEAAELNTIEVVSPQGLPVIQPPPILENVKIEVKPKLTTVVKRGPMRAIIPIPGMLKAGAGTRKDEPQVVTTGSNVGKKHFPRGDSSSKNIKLPLLRSKTSEAMIVRGSKSNISGSGMRAPLKKTCSEETLGPRPSKSGVGSSQSGLQKQQPSLTTLSAAKGVKKVLAPVSKRPTNPLAKPNEKKPKPQVLKR